MSETVQEVYVDSIDNMNAVKQWCQDNMAPDSFEILETGESTVLTSEATLEPAGYYFVTVWLASSEAMLQFYEGVTPMTFNPQ